MIKKFRASHAAVDIARRVNSELVFDVDLEMLATKIDEELQHAVPLLVKFEKALERGADLNLDRSARIQLDIDLSDTRTVLHSFKPINQEIVCTSDE